MSIAGSERLRRSSKGDVRLGNNEIGNQAKHPIAKPTTGRAADRRYTGVAAGRQYNFARAVESKLFITAESSFVAGLAFEYAAQGYGIFQRLSCALSGM